MIPSEARTRPYRAVSLAVTAYTDDEITIPPVGWHPPKRRRWWPWWCVGAAGLLAPGMVWAALVFGMGAR